MLCSQQELVQGVQNHCSSVETVLCSCWDEEKLGLSGFVKSEQLPRQVQNRAIQQPSCAPEEA